MPNRTGTCLGVVVTLALTACSAGNRSSAQILPSTSTSGSSLTTLAAPSTTSTATTLGVPTNLAVATGQGALLAAPPPPVTQSPAGPQAGCRQLGDPGWAVSSCNKMSFPDASRVWLVEHRPGPATTDAWRVLLLHFSLGKGVWLVDLWYKDDQGDTVLDIKVVSGDVTGTKAPALVVGYRLLGSGSILDYDVIATLDSATPSVAVHRALSHGQATVGSGQIIDYEARYPNGEPNCCPAYFQKSSVHYRAPNWVVTPLGHVAAASTGDF